MNTNSYMESPINTYQQTFSAILQTMIQDMLKPIPLNSISDTFIRQMIPHHIAALEMSRNITQYHVDPSIKNMAMAIINNQTANIEALMQAGSSCRYVLNTESEIFQYQQEFLKIISSMFYKMAHPQKTDNLNCLYISEMLPHHEGAIKMSENLLRYPICTQLIPLAQNIITDQTKNIGQLTQLAGTLCIYEC